MPGWKICRQNLSRRHAFVAIAQSPKWRLDRAQFSVRCYPKRHPEQDLLPNAVPRWHAKLLNLLATPAGFEPATFSLEGCCSIP